MASFEIMFVQESWPQSMEQMGTKDKFWFEDNSERLWLFKYIRENTGEDWSEKIAEYLCNCLGLPHATYELAITWKSGRGVASLSFLRSNEQLILGNQLLGTIDLGYLQKRKKYRNSFHTVDAVMQSLEKVAPPRGWNLPQGIKTAPEVFVGYLMLDALIGNGDRHDENWAVVEGISGMQQALAPTFDHASSLGMLLGDEERRQRLTTKDRGYSVAVYANKATSALYQSVSDLKPLSTLAAFVEAGNMYPQAARLWLAQLSSVAMEDFAEGLGKIPKNRISSVAIDFALRLLAHNMARLQQTL